MISRFFFSVSYQCGSSTSENGTYFSSPAPPQRICNLLIHRVNDDICQVMILQNSYVFPWNWFHDFFQVKVVFDLFDLSDPDPDGICASDFFLATGGSPVPQICGTNTGHHSKLKINLLPSLWFHEIF